MRSIFWFIPEISEIIWYSYNTWESEIQELDLEHPIGTSRKVNLRLCLRSVYTRGLPKNPNYCEWFVKLENASPGDDDNQARCCQDLQLECCFKVNVGMHETDWSELQDLNPYDCPTIKFCEERKPDVVKYLNQASKKQIPAIFQFSVLRPKIRNPFSWNRYQEDLPILCLASQDTPSINHDLRQIKDREKFADVTITCGDVDFKCHKVVLAARSEVFDSMFSHADTEENKSGKIVITDVEPQVMEQMLNFVYADSCQPSNWEDAMKLLICGDKYNLPGLKNVCKEGLNSNMENLDVNFVVKLFKWSHLLKLSKMKASCLHTISWKFKKVLETEEWPSVEDDAELRSEVLLAVSKVIPQPKRIGIDSISILSDY